MLLRAGYLSPSLRATSSLFSLLSTTSPFLINYTPYSHNFHKFHSLSFKSANPFLRLACRNKLSQNLCTATVAANAAVVKDSYPRTTPVSTRSRKKSRRESPSGLLLHKLCLCSKENDLLLALRLYEEARVNNVALTADHYNKLLYLCSSSLTDLGLEKGFEIYKQMGLDKVVPNEATFTNAARLAAAKEDPEMAFDLVKKMKSCGITPKLRSYVPALFGFCKQNLADKAYEVDAYMVESGVVAEESELLALLSVSSNEKRVDKVYEMLHRLRASVRQVSEETAAVVEEWFRSDTAGQVGESNWDVEKVKEGVVNGGGGWHGQGWLGSGKWDVVRTEMDGKGVCQSCGERLVSIDIDPTETENFARSLSTLACEKEARSDFLRFQEWLRWHGPFDAVVDGANVGLIKQHTFSFSQLKSVVDSLRELSPSKRLPLIVLHRGRVTGGPAQNPRNKKLLQYWKESGALYSTPQGSNDDWYWLYAAISSKCLLVTNDEMRDHLFQLLGTSFFPRWKEKHQVRLTVSNSGPNLHMPPPYSIVIQESEQGNWHIPTVTGDDLETRRGWVCASRNRHSSGIHAQ